VRNTNFRGNQGYNWNRPYSPHNGGQRGTFTSRDTTGPGRQARDSNNNHGGSNPRANSYDPGRNDNACNEPRTLIRTGFGKRNQDDVKDRPLSSGDSLAQGPVVSTRDTNADMVPPEEIHDILNYVSKYPHQENEMSFYVNEDNLHGCP
jgi:hypothetical protein